MKALGHVCELQLSDGDAGGNCSMLATAAESSWTNLRQQCHDTSKAVGLLKRRSREHTTVLQRLVLACIHLPPRWLDNTCPRGLLVTATACMTHPHALA